MKTAPLTQVYEEIATLTHTDLATLLPGGTGQEAGHFDVFTIEDLFATMGQVPAAPLP